jgi:hypothetical protein
MDYGKFDVRQVVLSVLETCSQCHQPYELQDIRIVGRHGNLWVLAVSCSHCDAHACVAAVVSDSDVEDVTAEESASNADAGTPVTVDDVLDMHEFLESFDGDFHALFSGRRDTR